MATWKQRFEDLFAEIEGVESSRAKRKRLLKELIVEHLHLMAQEGTLSTIDIEKALNFYDEIDFYEDI